MGAKRIKITEEQKNSIVEKYKTGQYAVKRLSREFNLYPKFIERLLIGLGLEIVKFKPKAIISELDKNDIVRDYLSGEAPSIYFLAKRYKTSQERIREIIVSSGNKTKEPNDNRRVILSDEQKKEIISLVSSGVKVYDIPAKLSFVCCIKIIKKLIKKTFPFAEKEPYTVSWKKRYSPELYEQKMKDLRERVSKRNSGKNNGHYGKPPCKKHSSGIHGWYKDLYHFRSLRELSYMFYLEESGKTWETGESKNFAIEYTDFDGKIRSYWPDFILEDSIIEIKPIQLQKLPNVQAKARAAHKICAEKGIKYELIDFLPDMLKIKRALDEGLIVFAKNCEERFLKYLKKTNPTLLTSS